MKNHKLSLSILRSICDYFSIFANHSNKVNETIEEIDISGLNFPNLIQQLKGLNELLENSDLGKLTIDVNGQGCNIESLDILLEPIRSWRVIYIKKSNKLIEAKNNHCVFYFVLYDSFLKWLSALNPASSINSFIKKENIVIFVNGLSEALHTEQCRFIPLKSSSSSIEFSTNIRTKYPSDLQIKDYVHVMNNSYFNIPFFVPIKLNETDPLHAMFLLKCTEALSLPFINTLDSNGNALIKGKTFVEVKIICGEYDKVTLHEVNSLAKLVGWAYQDKQETRLKLVRDRISLIIDKTKAFPSELAQNAESILLQCTEEFEYFISDLRSEFELEKRAFLSDLKDTATKYFEQIHVLINGLIRDIIAIAFFVGFNISSKILESTNILDSEFLPFFIKGIGLYLIFSLIAQGTINILEYSKLNKNTKAWATHTKSFMHKDKVNEYIKEYTGSTKSTFKTVLILWSIIYISLSFLFLNPKCFINPILEKCITSKSVEMTSND